MSMADEQRTVRICFCPDRVMAMSAQTFRYSHQWGGWWMTDAPTRTMSSHARYYAFHERAEYRHEDHEGEPYIHRDCPWCGNSLPGTVLGPGAPQADGGSEGSE